ncbi:conserved exported hypothetical protein [Gammaproteobacteria bacterium]
MNRITTLSVLAWTILGISPVLAADANHSEQLHQQQCLSCHNLTVYTRPDHFVTNLGALRRQVTRCEAPTNANWTDEDMNGVIDYLNSNFYHFPAQ